MKYEKEENGSYKREERRRRRNNTEYTKKRDTKSMNVLENYPCKRT